MNTRIVPTHTSNVTALALKQRSCARKRKRCESDFEASIVDLDTYKTPSPEPPSHWVSNLTVKDEQVLTHGRWLNDSLVNASQLLIKQAYPHIQGLQDVALGMTFAFDVMQGEFVQVLHDGQAHWVTISTIGCQQAEVDVFDSLFIETKEMSKELQSQIAALLHTDQDVITVRYVIIHICLSLCI